MDLPLGSPPLEPWRSGLLPARSWMPQHHKLEQALAPTTGSNHLLPPILQPVNHLQQLLATSPSTDILAPILAILPSQVLPAHYMAIRH